MQFLGPRGGDREIQTSDHLMRRGPQQMLRVNYLMTNLSTQQFKL